MEWEWWRGGRGGPWDGDRGQGVNVGEFGGENVEPALRKWGSWMSECEKVPREAAVRCSVSGRGALVKTISGAYFIHIGNESQKHDGNTIWRPHWSNYVVCVCVWVKTRPLACAAENTWRKKPWIHSTDGFSDPPRNGWDSFCQPRPYPRETMISHRYWT